MKIEEKNENLYKRKDEEKSKREQRGVIVSAFIIVGVAGFFSFGIRNKS